MQVNQVIADNLNQICNERKLSLRQLSKISGVSNTTLAQIANGEGNPTINVLLKITSALKVPYTRLIDEVRRDVTVVRLKDRINLEGELASYQSYNYFPYSPQRNFEFFYVELDPLSKHQSPKHVETAQEYIFVIQGTLLLTTGTSTLRLHQQDGAWFESAVPHSYENPETTPLQFISINYYP